MQNKTHFKDELLEQIFTIMNRVWQQYPIADTDKGKGLPQIQAEVQTMINSSQIKDLPKIFDECERRIKLGEAKCPEEMNEKTRLELRGMRKIVEDYIRDMKIGYYQPSEEYGDLLSDFVDLVKYNLRTDWLIDEEKGHSNVVMKLNKPILYPDIKARLPEICESSGQQLFIISNHLSLSGTIISAIGTTPKQIPLVERVSEVQNSVTTTFYRFFGESFSKSPKSVKLTAPFYVYRFRSRDKNTYILLSLKELKLNSGKIQGMYVPLFDETKVGETTTLPLGLPVIFVHSFQPDIKEITYDEFTQITADWDINKMSDLIFNKFKHPEWFEKLILAWVFSGKFSGFPLHLGWVADPGTGKSVLLDSLWKVSGEMDPVCDGSTATLKFLVPNFGRNQADEGYLAKSNRFGFIDEFFTMLTRNMHGTNGISASDETGLLTSLLEHKVRLGGSGNTSSIEVNPTCRVLFATNPKPRILPDLPSAAQKINNAFMSRILWYVQTQHHIDFVRNNQLEVELMPPIVPYLAKEDFVMVMDYLTSQSVELDAKVVKTIFTECSSFVPADLAGVYDARYRHHIACLLDGYAKLNSILEHRPKLTLTDADVEEVKTTLTILVTSWNSAIEFDKLPVRLRKEYISAKLREYYDFVEHSAHCTIAEISSSLNKPFNTVKSNLMKLVELGLIVEIHDEFYPFWHEKAKQVNNALIIQKHMEKEDD